MVLPEDLINYVKEKLTTGVPVANIISDVKSKGYEISSSTIYKIRATMEPQHLEVPLTTLEEPPIIKPNNTPKPPMEIPTQNFVIPDESHLNGLLVAAIDIEQFEILVQMSKNEENLLTREYKFENDLLTVMGEIDEMCSEMMVNSVMITSQFFRDVDGEEFIDLGVQKYNISSFTSCKPEIIPYINLIAVHYSKQFLKDIILISIGDTVESLLCVKKTFVTYPLLIGHMVIAKHPQDMRPKRICKYHDYCLENFVTLKSIDKPDRDFDFMEFYIAELVYNLYLSHPDTVFILTGKIVSKFTAEKILEAVTETLTVLAASFCENFLPNTFLHIASEDSAILGGVQMLEKAIEDEPGVSQNIQNYMCSPTGYKPLEPNIMEQNQNVHAGSGKPAISNGFIELEGEIKPNPDEKTASADNKLFSRVNTAVEGEGTDQTGYEMELLANMVQQNENDE